MPDLSDPCAVFGARLAIVAPHADDETLGCGALIARLSASREIHVIFATDSSRSPEPADRAGADPAGLAAAREQEAVAAMQVLGVPKERLHFLRFPDSRLREHESMFRPALVEALAHCGATDVLVPFRYDWHPDHVAVHRAAASAFAALEFPGRLMEYFVYTQRRLLPRGDIREYLNPARTIRVAGEEVAHLKLRALQCFRSQTTLYFGWQRRPILTPQLLRRMCAAPESFLPYDPAPRRVLRGARWIRAASALEPPLKRLKDGAAEWLSR